MREPPGPQDFDSTSRDAGNNTPRYCPGRAFPAYRHRPGITPHPERDPAGHSYQHEEQSVQRPDPEGWAENELYLFGVDLFNHRYWWEAHQAWEALWFAAGKATTSGMFLQALIQLAAALLKQEQQSFRGVRKLAKDARHKLEMVHASGKTGAGCFLGLHIPSFLEHLNSYFEPFLDGSISEEEWKCDEDFPRIVLKLR